MLCTELLKDGFIYPTLQRAQTISAQNIHVVSPGELISEFFHLDCCLWITLRTEDMHTFSKNCDSWTSGICSTCRDQTKICKRLHEKSWVRHPVNENRGERIRSVKSEISALFNSSSNMHTVRLQPRNKIDPVRFCRCYDSRIPVVESRADEQRQVI